MTPQGRIYFREHKTHICVYVYLWTSCVINILVYPVMQTSERVQCFVNLRIYYIVHIVCLLLCVYLYIFSVVQVYASSLLFSFVSAILCKMVVYILWCVHLCISFVVYICVYPLFYTFDSAILFISVYIICVSTLLCISVYILVCVHF